MEVRPTLAHQPDDGTLFLSNQGDMFSPNRLTQMVREYVDGAQLGKTGACHLFRHTMATLMLENGADIRFIQAMLGHAELSTTQIYTQVSIRKLKEIHSLTHPARLEKPITPTPTPPPTADAAADDHSNADAQARDQLLDALADDDDGEIDSRGFAAAVFTASPPSVTLLSSMAAKEKTSRLTVWLAPILFLLAAVAAAGPASALTCGALETRAWEKTPAPLESRPVESLQLLNLHQQNESGGYDSALGSPLAAESATPPARTALPLSPESQGTVRLTPKYENVPPSMMQRFPRPDVVPYPSGDINLRTGSVYKSARQLADRINKTLRRGFQTGQAGQDIHEINPVKLGGSPTDLANKMGLPRPLHRQVTAWFRELQNLIEGK